MTSNHGPPIDYARAFNQLCHFVALTTTGKIDAAVDNLVVTTIAVSGERLTGPTSVASAVVVLFGAARAEDRVRDAIDRQLSDGVLIRDGATGQLYPSRDAAAAIQARVAAARDLEQRVRQQWLADVRQTVPLPGDIDDDQLWRCLTRYLTLALQRHGAETQLLLDPSAFHGQLPAGPLSGYMDSAIRVSGLDGHADVVNAAFDLFFSQASADQGLYLAQLLDGTFTFFALTLDESTSTYLKESLQPLDLFLDTNFIFGLLDLHDNFLVGASKELIRFVRDHDLPFNLYYHEYTFTELQRTLDNQAEGLRARRWEQALSRAAVAADVTAGVERLYHRLNAQAPTDVEAFLSRYQNLRALLAPLGLEIYRLPGAAPFSLEEKALVIADYKEFLDRAAPRPRAYAALDHDASIWLSLRRLRTTGAPALSSGALFLTNDYWFHRWDKSNRDHGGTPGAIVLPTQLLQILRPFVPSTDDFDRRFGETFGLPEFRTVQTGYTRTAGRVLSLLATYKDLSEETATAILTDYALHTKLRELPDESPQLREAVEAEVVKLNQVLLEEKVAVAAELERKEAASAESAAAARRELEATTKAAADASTKEAAAAKRADVAETRLRHLMIAIKTAVSLAILLGGIAGLILGPDFVSFPWAANHPRRIGLSIAAVVVVAALPVFLFSSRYRREALVAGILGGVLVIAQIL